MKEFKYTAIMLNGKRVSNTVMATDYTEAKKLLKEKKMRIIELKEKKVSTLFTSKKSKKKKLKSDQISHFCRQFGIIISS